MHLTFVRVLLLKLHHCPSAPTRRFFAIKVFDAKSTQGFQKVANSLDPLGHLGEKYIELPLDSFTICGPNGGHACLVLEPMGGATLNEFLKDPFDVRLNSEGLPGPRDP